MQAVLWPQRYQWLRNHAVAGSEPEFPLLRKGCEEEGGFHPREAFANAPTRPATEWEVGILRQCGPEFRCPAFGIKAERFYQALR